MQKLLIITQEQRHDWMKNVILCAAQKFTFGCYYIVKEHHKFAVYNHPSDGTPKYADLDEAYYGLKESKDLKTLVEYINNCNRFWFFRDGEIQNKTAISLEEAIKVAEQY